MENIREIKKRIRALRKVKKDMRIGTQQRRDINTEIRKLKDRLEETQGNSSPEKDMLIKEIYILRPEWKVLRNFNLNNFSIEELKKHLEITKKKRNI